MGTHAPGQATNRVAGFHSQGQPSAVGTQATQAAQPNVRRVSQDDAPVQEPSPQQHPIPPSDKYDVERKIGEGTYGVVYLAKTKPQPTHTSQYVAVKTFKSGKDLEGVSLTAIREIMLLRELHHPNVVDLLSVHISRKPQPSLSLVFGYADHDLYDMIKYHRDQRQRNGDASLKHFDAYTVKSVMWGLLRGLAYLHRNWIIHRDLKPSNILVLGDGPGAGMVKIADFGLARIFQGIARPLVENGVVVTIWYRAPELLLGTQDYGVPVDIWAAACIFAELLTLKPLFKGIEKKSSSDAFQYDQLDKIFALLGHPSPRNWPGMEQLKHWHENTCNIRIRHAHHKPQLEQYLCETNPDITPGCQALDFLNKMLRYDPKQRWTAEQLLEHPYFKEAPLPGDNVLASGRGVRYPGRAPDLATKYKSAEPTRPALHKALAGRGAGQKRALPPAPVPWATAGGAAAASYKRPRPPPR